MLAKLLKSWSGRPGSNRRRPAWEAGILPLNYARSRPESLQQIQHFFNLTARDGSQPSVLVVCRFFREAAMSFPRVAAARGIPVFGTLRAPDGGTREGDR